MLAIQHASTKITPEHLYQELCGIVFDSYKYAVLAYEGVYWNVQLPPKIIDIFEDSHDDFQEFVIKCVRSNIYGNEKADIEEEVKSMLLEDSEGYHYLRELIMHDITSVLSQNNFSLSITDSKVKNHPVRKVW